MSLAERYSRAARSSDLELKVDIGDVDYLIAAGLIKDSLPTRLIRLRSEFDAVKGNRALMRLLSSFEGARQYLKAHALQEARYKTPLSQNEVLELADQVLDLFLDPNCPACTGRKYNGGNGAPTIRCAVCRESGRREPYFRDDAQETFARWLQWSIETKVDRALVIIMRLVKLHRPVVLVQSD